MSNLKRLVQCFFYAAILALILSRAVSSGINHDENQFISPGQLLADQGLLPYRDYPYTHMPYAIPFYALAVSISKFDYLATRLLGVLTWMGCIAAVVAIFHLTGRYLSKSDSWDVSWAALLGEFGLVIVFVYHPLAVFLQGSPLNHMLGTLFSLLALLMFLRGVTGIGRLQTAAFWSGCFICIAGLTRFNYAGLVPVLWSLWLVYVIIFKPSHPPRLQATFMGGVLVAAVPALVLAAMAPAHFYYGNIAYIQLNTLYYRGMRLRETMDLASKVAVFVDSVVRSPLTVILYAVAVTSTIVLVVRMLRRQFLIGDMIAVAGLAFAGTLLLTAFAPTPTQLQYFFGPLPFILVVLALPVWLLYQKSRLAYMAACFLLVALVGLHTARPGPIQELQVLLHPEAWPPLQIHAFADRLSSQQHVPPGRILAILPMVPSEAGYASYPFTATGPFSWRTSVLLSAQRREQYGVTSPEELPSLLDAAPPVAILTGLEPPKAGFTYRDTGGLERPFEQYAEQHGYAPLALYAPFLEHSVTLWVRRP